MPRILRLKGLLWGVMASVLLASGDSCTSDDFSEFVAPLVRKNCLPCHGGKEINAEIDFGKFTSRQKLLNSPDLIKEMMDVIDAGDMPPEDQPQLTPNEQKRLLEWLRKTLHQATETRKFQPAPIHRLNRFQYNNSVRDLFELDRDVFALPEKLMRRNDNYFSGSSRKMPSRLQVFSNALDPVAGLRNVKPFPKDLRAAHGYDNQANQLTLSPLLLDSFFKLSVSIVESPDFHAKSVGIWDRFFKKPELDGEQAEEIQKRIAWLLRMAFRSTPQPAVIKRYTDYAQSKLAQGEPFESTMKKVASAVLSSPLFLFRVDIGGEGDHSNVDRQLALASRLSYFLWGSCPDQELLDLAEKGELAKPDVLSRTIDRMLADRKIERFLDSFPAQWMQLENLLSVTPDPAINRFFFLDRSRPASHQMMIEPLLLFDSLYVENRPVREFISPEFNYRSQFLKTWYQSDLKPEVVDIEKVLARNLELATRRRELLAKKTKIESELSQMLTPVREAILKSKQANRKSQPIDLKPLAAWEFNGDLKSSVGGLNLSAKGKIRFEDGKVVLNQSFLQSSPLPVDLKEKSLEVWLELDDVNQRGGGAMGIQGPGGIFDTIVLGERKPQQWIAGSNNFVRTEDFPEAVAESEVKKVIQLVMVFSQKGTALFRNGKNYGKPYKKGLFLFPGKQSSVLFGLRHLPPGGNRYLKVKIDRARLYDRALTDAEVRDSFRQSDFVTDLEIEMKLNTRQKAIKAGLVEQLKQTTTHLEKLPAEQDPNQLNKQKRDQFDNRIRQQLRDFSFERTPARDPRYGGVITNAAILSMTSGPKRTHPIARGAWIIEVVFNDPPPPPPNDVPPLKEEADDRKLTIRERFAAHRENPDCAACHSRLDPLGFALENFDITGRWRDRYPNGRDVDMSGTLLKKHEFKNIVEFKSSIHSESKRFARAFASHLLRFALGRELVPRDALVLETIVQKASATDYRLRDLIRNVIDSDSFLMRD